MRKYPVIIAGAGIGGIDNLSYGTIKALRWANYIVYDRLIASDILSFAPDAEKIYAGKAKNKHHLSQDAIHDSLLSGYRAGKKVLRLKGGDPFVFGRGGEEAQFLKTNGIPFRILSGITSGVAVPAMAHIPVTHRDIARSVTFLTAYSKDGAEDLSPYASLETTLVVYMGLSNAKSIAKDLIRAGKDENTPIAILSRGGEVDMRSYFSTLKVVAEKDLPPHLISPAILIIGDVVSLRESIDPTPLMPLGNKHLIFTDQNTSNTIQEELKHLGAVIHHHPMIAIKPMNEDALKSDIQTFDAELLVFTSKYAVDIFMAAFLKEWDIRALYNTIIYVLGEKTADAVSRWGLRAAGLPSVYNAKHLAKLLQKKYAGDNKKVYYPHSNLSHPFLLNALQTFSQVKSLSIYANEPPTEVAPLPEAIDGAVFLSPSAVTRFFDHYQKVDEKISHFFCLGPSTLKALVKAGIKRENIYVAEKATTDSLFEKILKELCHHENA